MIHCDCNCLFFTWSSTNYKKQEAAWSKSSHKEPYDGQNLEVHDKKISELEDTQAKLDEERAK